MKTVGLSYFIMNVIFCSAFFSPTAFSSTYFIEQSEISTGANDYLAATLFGNFLQQIDALISMNKVNDNHLIQAVEMIRRSFLEQQMNNQLTSKRLLCLMEKFSHWLVWYEQKSFKGTDTVFLHTLQEISMQALNTMRREIADDRGVSKNSVKDKKLLCIGTLSFIAGLLYYSWHFSDRNSFFNRLTGAIRLQTKIHRQHEEQAKLESVLKSTVENTQSELLDLLMISSTLKKEVQEIILEDTNNLKRLEAEADAYRNFLDNFINNFFKSKEGGFKKFSNLHTSISQQSQAMGSASPRVCVGILRSTSQGDLFTHQVPKEAVLKTLLAEGWKESAELSKIEKNVKNLKLALILLTEKIKKLLREYDALNADGAPHS